jgi:ABC-type hemin transport system ATPase subunit
VLLIRHDADLAATCDEVLVLVAGRFAAPGRRP